MEGGELLWNGFLYISTKKKRIIHSFIHFLRVFPGILKGEYKAVRQLAIVTSGILGEIMA